MGQPARRDVLKYAGVMTLSAAGAGAAPKALVSPNASSHPPGISPDDMGVLMDSTLCVGCRLCEYACKKSHGFETGPLESYDDQSVFAQNRRPNPTELTTVNAFSPENSPSPVYTKTNCLHCGHAACVSACIVGALEKKPGGAVVYDAWKCIGCRYCMVACPFQIPTYEYDNVLTPQVRKCNFCQPRRERGERPACVQECPRQALIYGKREDLLALARDRIAKSPGKYVDHIYGEHEVGGSCWLYLSPAPFEQIGFAKVGAEPPAQLTEAIQHGVFKHWIAPFGLYGFLASMYWLTGRRNDIAEAAGQGGAHRGGGIAPRISRDYHGSGIDPRISGDFRASRPSQSHSPQHPAAAPANAPLLTPGVWLLIALVLIGLGFALYRFVFGLAATTNLDQQHPWGLWIAMDVGSGIALAGGGFVTAALVHIFHREKYHAIARSALLTALLGYTFYVPGLLADLGRWYNLWHPILPGMWQGNSVLFEVGICVMLYLNVQYVELVPIVCSRLLGKKEMPRISAIARWVHDSLERLMPIFLIAGVTLSTFHQSSLGNLMVIAPTKLHPLWWSPWSPVFFLLSAIMVGFPMVIFTILFGSWSLGRKPEMNVLAPLSRYVPVFLFTYLAAKIGDMIWRGTYAHLAEVNLQSAAFILEIVAGVLAPLGMLSMASVRNSPRKLGLASLLVILGVVLNRLNVFIVGYRPPYAEKSYFPSLTEFALSIGLVAALMLAWRVAVTYLPILKPAPSANDDDTDEQRNDAAAAEEQAS